MLRMPPLGERVAAVRRARVVCALAVAALGSLALLGASDDAGVVLEVDRRRFALRAVDLERPARGPLFRVALGSRAHPTPTGVFPARRVIWNPDFLPGPRARARGARAVPPSSDGPLGVLKIPFGRGMAVHGGAHRFARGHRLTLGCVSALDEDLVALVAWLEERGALAPRDPQPSGEIHQRLRRPLRIRVR